MIVTAVRSTGATLSTATVPNPILDWTDWCWIKLGTSNGGAPTHNQLAFDDSTGGNPGVYLARDDATTSWNAYIWNGASVQGSQNISNALPTEWTWIARSHAAGSATYSIYWRTNGAPSLSSIALTGTQYTGLNKLWIASDDGGETEIDGSYALYGCTASLRSTAELLAISQSPVLPAGLLHALPLASAATAVVNLGSGGNWTPAGAFTDVAAGPVFPGVTTLSFASNF